MIEAKIRQAIYCLNQEGMGVREISRRLKVSRNTVSKIIKEKGEKPFWTRKDKIEIDNEYELLTGLYSECQGRIQRMHEKLTEEQGIKIGYSTLVRKVRQLGLGQGKTQRRQRCGKVEDQPGLEMQHDTSNYTIKLRKKNFRVIGSLLYFRYSKMRYLWFYRSFNRFRMKCFFHEALTHLGYTARECIIDNTNLARLRGTGKDAVIVPEMEQFSSRYGFKFICHEKGHSNRKAGNERSFYTVETNFFPGRQFDSLEDLNQQALNWATVRIARRPVGKSRLIPAHLFEYEIPFLTKLTGHIPPPYIFDTRDIDQYGHVSYGGNYYWIPGSSRFGVTVLEYSKHIEVYHGRELLIKYPLPPDGVKNQIFRPQGYKGTIYQPKNRKKPTETEEKNLRSLSQDVNNYMDFIVKQKGIKKHRFIRSLYRLSHKIALPVFTQALKRALKYRIVNIDTIEHICILLLRSGSYQLPSSVFDVTVNEDFSKRDSFLEGEFSGEVDLCQYDRLLED
jgi:transposase